MIRVSGFTALGAGRSEALILSTCNTQNALFYFSDFIWPIFLAIPASRLAYCAND